MPITKSAIKALRQDVKRASFNKPVRSRVKSTQDTMKATPNTDNLSKAFSAIDRGVKKHLMHKNKAARLKSQLSRLISTKK